MPTVERTISGTGELLIPLEEFEETRELWLYLDIIRQPTNKFVNKNYFPERSEYAKILFLYNNYVIREETMRYERQAFKLFDEQPSQNMISMICMYDGILESFLELASCINECVPISKTNLIKLHPTRLIDIDQILIRCYSSTALQAVVSSSDYVRCQPEDGQKEPPPPPPQPPEEVPVDEPVEVSEPNENSPPENTQPFPDDLVPDPPGEVGENEYDPPIGDNCQRFSVSTIIRAVNTDGEFEETPFSAIYFGPITGTGYIPGDNPGSRTWVVFSRGQGFTGCVEPGNFSAGELVNDAQGGTVRVVDIEAI